MINQLRTWGLGFRVTFEGLPFNSSMISFRIWLFKKSIHTLQNNVHMLSFPILHWVHTWENGRGHTSLDEIQFGHI